VLRLIQIIGQLPLLRIYVIQALKLIKIFGGVFLSLFYIMMNCIGELLKINLLLHCLDDDQARVALGEVHEGICGTHQSALKMKWLLLRACFYWTTLIAN
jgi:hypothetical protein